MRLKRFICTRVDVEIPVTRMSAIGLPCMCSFTPYLAHRYSFAPGLAHLVSICSHSNQRHTLSPFCEINFDNLSVSPYSSFGWTCLHGRCKRWLTEIQSFNQCFSVWVSPSQYSADKRNGDVRDDCWLTGRDSIIQSMLSSLIPSIQITLLTREWRCSDDCWLTEIQLFSQCFSVWFHPSQ